MALMSDKPELKTLRTEVTPTTGPVEHPHAAPADEDKLPLLGWFAVGFAVLGIFTYAPLFVPLGLVLGIIALFIGQIGLGITAVLLSIVGVLTSPTLMIMLGLGALGAWFGFSV